MIPGLNACNITSADVNVPFDEDWYYRNMGESCSIVKTLDLMDEFDPKDLKHTWPGLDDRIGNSFSASITGYLNIGPSAEYTFHITCKQTVSLFFDTATEPLMFVSGGGIHNATIHLDSGLHLMQLYINSFCPNPRLLVQYSSPSVGLPLTTINDMVTFVGGM